MSALDRPKIEDAERVITDAENVLSEVCHGKRRFEMCIPVQETDTDIVIGNALYIARQLLAQLAALKTVVTWRQLDYEDGDCWECSGCKFVSVWEDSPEENEVKFCTSCGHPVTFERYEEPREDEE